MLSAHSSLFNKHSKHEAWRAVIVLRGGPAVVPQSQFFVFDQVSVRLAALGRFDAAGDTFSHRSVVAHRCGE